MFKVVIEIDCPPMSPRPDTYIGEGYTCVSKVFGNWTFVKSVATEKEAKAEKEHYGEKLTSLYRSGAIRYASWDYTREGK